eukprot:TRINITY_DN326_c2_g2_i2.p1 TRINITY_DN326_c2_g2~~TRINITY_DN326_c2_g2_i2.p1  ORF type:complete len:498 (-),score=144.47 TRINITY_DN326_c2_g2_i2:547-2040(-)
MQQQIDYLFTQLNQYITMTSRKVLTEKSISQRVVKAEYAVRGEVVIQADTMQQQISTGENTKLKEIVLCNIGNPQALKQQPITFFRQVLACMQYPPLCDQEGIFPKDVIARARHYLKSVKLGAYSNSIGVKVVRDEVAAFIERRDGFPANPADICLTDGASPAVKNTLQTIIRSPKDGVLVPIPQYPLYSASLTLLGGQICGYYLNEKAGWGMELQNLNKALQTARSKGIHVRALVVINPGNPTGQTLPLEQMQDIIGFCKKEHLVLLADEVYQTNIYGSTPFTSFKKALRSMNSDVELISFHSVSKGFLGECGQRGGYMELVNIDTKVQQQMCKLASISLCSNITGQIMVGMMVNPPKSGEESYPLYQKEKDAILSSLKRRAKKVAEMMNSTKGVSCNDVEGAMYAFPSIHLPKAFIEEAKQANKQPDLYYCLRLLEETGIVTVPGSGFGQKKGTYHFRTTILPQESVMEEVLARFKKFHEALLEKYGDAQIQSKL